MAKFCRNCGKELNEEQNVCLNCGVVVNNIDKLNSKINDNPHCFRSRSDADFL